MSPIVTTSRKFDLGNGKTLFAVRNDRDSEVILSIVEDDGAITRRMAVKLSLPEAMNLARTLANISIHGERLG